MGERRVTEWLSAFFTSNAVFGIFFLTLLIFYFSSERSVLHFRLKAPKFLSAKFMFASDAT